MTATFFHMFGVMKKFMPPPPQRPPPSPFEWGKYERLKELLGGNFELKFEEGTNRFRYGAGEQAWNLWVNHYGPVKSLAANLRRCPLRRVQTRHDRLARDIRERARIRPA